MSAKRLFYLVIGVGILLLEPLGAQVIELPLYMGTIPGANEIRGTELVVETANGRTVRNVVLPSLTAYLPADSLATGTAIVVAPGGGLRALSWDNEGTRVAAYLRDRGIAAFVLKYRLVPTGTSDQSMGLAMAQFGREIEAADQAGDDQELLRDTTVARVFELAKEDGRQAIRHLRRHAQHYGLHPNKIGMMGFSAGGIITLGIGLQHDAESRPDFIIPIYAITLDKLDLPTDAPPLLYVCAADDTFTARRAHRLYNAWLSAGKLVSFHIYSRGGHGFGMRSQGLPVDGWKEEMLRWLQSENFVAAPK